MEHYNKHFFRMLILHYLIDLFLVFQSWWNTTIEVVSVWEFSRNWQKEKRKKILPQTSVQCPIVRIILIFSPVFRVSLDSNFSSSDTVWYFVKTTPMAAIMLKIIWRKINYIVRHHSSIKCCCSRELYRPLKSLGPAQSLSSLSLILTLQITTLLLVL